MCGAEELQDDMSLKQVYLMNWSPRVSKKKKDIIILKKQILHVYSLLNYIIVLVQCFFGTCIHLPQFRVSDMLL